MSSVDQPSWEKLFGVSRENTIAGIHTGGPGIVVSYDRNARTAVVQPATYAGDEPLDPIEDVPVLFPRGGGFRLVWDLKKGDEVEIKNADVDPSRFRVTGETSLSDNVRRGGMYANAIPSSSSDPRLAEITSEAGAISLGTDDGTTDIVVKDGSIDVLSSTVNVVADTIKLGATTTADYVALASKVDQLFTTLKAAIAAGLTAVGAGPAANGATGATAFNSAFSPTSVASSKVGIDS